MQGKRFKSQESVRDQWTQQKSGGSHFAKPGSQTTRGKVESQDHPIPQAKSVKLPQVVAKSNQSITGSSKKTSPLDSSMIPRVVTGEENRTTQRRAVITGASGVFPKVGTAKPVKRAGTDNKQYSRYNNGYFDRPDAKQFSDMVAQFQTEPVEGAPAYTWIPFVVYGAVAGLACIAWLVVVLVVGMAPIRGATAGMGAGLALLAVIVFGGILVAAITGALTMKRGIFDRMDVFASALGKAALMMLAAVVVWIVCCAIAS